MGFINRVVRAIKANLNALISKAENPEKMLNQLLMEMNSQLIESKKRVALAIADEKKLERQAKRNAELAKEWENKAILAVKAGEDDLAKEALLRKQEYENFYLQYQKELEAQHEAVNKLKESLRQLQLKIDDAQRKKNLLIARAKRAETQKKIHETVGNMVDTSAFDAFDKMAEKVEELEAEAEAAGEVEMLEKPDTLEERFKKLEEPEAGREKNGDRLLEDLKKKLRELEDNTNK